MYVPSETPMDVIDHYYHYLSQEMDGDLTIEQIISLPSTMLNQDEITFLMTAINQYQKNCLMLEKVRLMDIGSLATFCMVLKSIDHKAHLGSVLLNGKRILIISCDYICILYYAALQTFGFITNAKEQSITMIPKVNMSDPQTRKRPFFLEHPTPLKHVKQYEGSISALKTQETDIAGTHTPMDTSVQSLSHPEQKRNLKSKFVETDFLNVKNQLQHNIVLQSYDLKAMLEKCENLMTSDTNNIFLFSRDQLQKLTECKQAPELIQKLSPHFNWSNHSVLHEVIRCNNTAATNLLDQFDSQIDSSLPVTDYPIPQPSPNMIPYDTSSHTVLAVKLNTQVRSISLQQVFDIQHLLQEQLQLSPHTFQLLAANSVPILYWMIPKCAVSVITSSVTKHRHFLYQNGIMELSIYPGLIYATSDTVRVGSLSFLNHYAYFEVYNHSNMIVCLVSCYKYCTYSCIGFKIRANSSLFSIKQSGGVYPSIAFVYSMFNLGIFYTGNSHGDLYPSKRINKSEEGIPNK